MRRLHGIDGIERRQEIEQALERFRKMRGRAPISLEEFDQWIIEEQERAIDK
jgi:hypothetical protein